MNIVCRRPRFSSIPPCFFLFMFSLANFIAFFSHLKLCLTAAYANIYVYVDVVTDFDNWNIVILCTFSFNNLLIITLLCHFCQ